MAKNSLKIIVITLFLISSLGYLPNENVEAYGKNTSLDDVDASFIAESYGGIWNNGTSASIVGDVNGDGFDDIAIAKEYVIWFQSYSCPMLAKVYLFFGQKSGWDKDFNMSDADATFFCKKWDHPDIEVTGVGDVNKDNYDDFLIGVTCDFYDHQGRAYLIFGKSDGWDKNFNLSKANVSFKGDDWDFGHPVVGVGDVNSDGYNDFIIGELRDAKKLYLYFGKSTGWHKNMSTDYANASFEGSFSVAGGGDVNKDGFDDILFGAPYYRKSYLFFGKKSGWIKNQSLESADASFIGANEDECLGHAVSNSGDVNGDGFDDILIGAPGILWEKNVEGKIYLIFGKSTGWQKNVSLANANASFLGESINDLSGYSISSSGDVNGDGFDDIIIGAPGNDSFHKNDGKTYVVLGKSSGWSHNYSLANTDASFIGKGEQNRSGAWVSSSGDVNDDGYDDILISNFGNYTLWWSRWWYEGPIGQTYLIFYDTNTKPTSISSVTFYSNINYTTQATEGYIDQTIYVELIGTDGDPASANVAEVQINSSITDPYGVELRLHETGLNTGKYRGSFEIASVSSQYHNRIGATFGETVQVTSKQDPNKFDTLLVEAPEFEILPKAENTTILEDRLYIQQFTSTGLPEDNLIWYCCTNASWLNWNASNHTVYGIPTNDDIGKFWVVMILIYQMEIYEHNYTLTVQNVNDAPEIIGAPKNITVMKYEHQELDFSPYIFDVDSPPLNLNLQTSSNYILVDGLKLKFYYNYTAPKNENVTINVTDGYLVSNNHYLEVEVEFIEEVSIKGWGPRGDEVSIHRLVEISFSTSMNHTSCVNAFSITPVVDGLIYWEFWEYNCFTFDPIPHLEYNTTYTVVFNKSARSSEGNPLNEDHSWNFTTLKNITENQNPIIQIDFPVNNSVFNVNETIYFDCINSTDPDGDLLKFLWKSNISGVLSTASQFNTYLPLGHHRITLFVNDAHGHNISTSVNIIVIPWNRPPVPIIDHPKNNDVFNDTDTIRFDATSSYDLDLDILDFYWHSNITGGFGYSSKFSTQLPEGRHFITLFVNDGYYHNVSVSINIVVLNQSTSPINGPSDGDGPGPPSTDQEKGVLSRYGLYIGVILIIAIITIFGFAAATEVGKYGLLSSFVPLYRRLKGKKVLDNETRGMVRGYILANPGEHYSTIKRTLKLPNGTLTYHLKVLEQEELVKSERDGIYKRFYPVEMQLPKNATHLTKIQETILNEIIIKPGITVGELGKKIKINPRVINYHIKALVSAGLIKAERFGKRNRYYVIEGIE